MSYRCEFAFAGELSTPLVDSFMPVDVRQQAGRTVVVIELRDRTDLFAVLARCELLGLEVVAFEALPDRLVDLDADRA